MPARIGPKTLIRSYLREWREYHDLTQEQVADRIGTTKGTIARWEAYARGERGRRGRKPTIEAYAEALGEPVGKLYELPPPREPQPKEKPARRLPGELQGLIEAAVARALRRHRG